MKIDSKWFKKSALQRADQREFTGADERVTRPRGLCPREQTTVPSPHGTGHPVALGFRFSTGFQRPRTLTHNGKVHGTRLRLKSEHSHAQQWLPTGACRAAAPDDPCLRHRRSRLSRFTGFQFSASLERLFRFIALFLSTFHLDFNVYCLEKPTKHTADHSSVPRVNSVRTCEGASTCPVSARNDGLCPS